VAKIDPQEAERLTPGDLSLDAIDKLLNEEKTLSVQLESASTEIASIEKLDVEDPDQSSATATLESLEIINGFLQRISSEQLVNHLSIARDAEVKKRQEMESNAMEFGLRVSDLNALQLPDEQWLLDLLESWKLTKDKINQIDEKIKFFDVEISDIQIKRRAMADPS